MGIFDFCCAKCGDSESGQERYGQKVLFRAIRKDGWKVPMMGIYNGYGAVEVGSTVFQDYGCFQEYGYNYTPDEESDYVAVEIYCEGCMPYNIPIIKLEEVNLEEFETVKDYFKAPSPIAPETDDESQTG